MGVNPRAGSSPASAICEIVSAIAVMAWFAASVATPLGESFRVTVPETVPAFALGQAAHTASAVVLAFRPTWYLIVVLMHSCRIRITRTWGISPSRYHRHAAADSSPATSAAALVMRSNSSPVSPRLRFGLVYRLKPRQEQLPDGCKLYFVRFIRRLGSGVGRWLGAFAPARRWRAGGYRSGNRQPTAAMPPLRRRTRTSRSLSPGG